MNEEQYLNNESTPVFERKKVNVQNTVNIDENLEIHQKDGMEMQISESN